MLVRKFKENWANMMAENALLKFVILLLVLGMLGEGALIVYMRINERTVIVPSYVDRTFYVEGAKASPEYIEMMSKYAVELVGNYTAETVRERYHEFLRFISPEHYKDVSTDLLSKVEEVKQYNVSQYFIPQRMTMEGDTITVDGLLRRYAQDKEIFTAGARYSIHYRINQGRFEIISYEAVEK